MSTDDKDDELLRRAQRLKEQAEQVSRNAASRPPSAITNRLHDIGWLRRLMDGLKAAMRLLGPVGRLLKWIARLVLGWFRWAALVKVESADTGTPEWSFSGSQFVFRTMLSLLILIALQVSFSAAYYYGTTFEETVYVTGKQEIVTGELYQFGGCTSLPCSTETDNGKFYLIESSLYFPVMFYPEENVFANIPQQDAACHVYGYGWYFRSLRWLYKSAQLYQHVTHVSCRPYTEDEIRRAVQEGRIVRDD
jgi:hypothetical protein